MRSRGAGRVMALAAAALALSACGNVADRGSDVVDSIAERGVAAYAEGRWRCETDENDGGRRRHLTTFVAVGGNGRFTYWVVGASNGKQVGTWSVEGLQLRLAVPRNEDGSNGFDQWVYDADKDPPTHLRGRQPEPEGEQELDVQVDKDRLTLVQQDEPGNGGANYDWDVTCTRESTDPGEIPPTVPASDSG